MRFEIATVALAAMAACHGDPEHQREAAAAADKIAVLPGARLAADAIDGSPRRATYVLVDAANRGSAGAYVTLGGDLRDGSGAPIDALSQQSLYIPAGATRTFALVDRALAERPDAKGAQVVVRGATVPIAPPPVRVDGVREIQDYGKLVVQGTLHNGADKPGEIVVIGSFHGSDGTPMTRPFTVMHLAANAEQTVQFVGPTGAAHAAIFIGDVTY